MTELDDVLGALEALLEAEGRPAATAPEIAEGLDQTRRKTLDDLRLLERAGDVESHDVGANATIWWPVRENGDAGGEAHEAPTGLSNSDTATDEADGQDVDEDTAPRDGQQRGESAPEPEGGLTANSADAVDVEHGERAGSARDEAAGPDRRDGVLEDLEFPAGRDRDGCVAAVHAARDYLREHGRATMRELVGDVMPEHPIGYDVPDLEPGERYRGAWWRHVVKPGLEALDDVEKPPRGGSDWRYTGDAGEDPTAGGVYDPTEEF